MTSPASERNEQGGPPESWLRAAISATNDAIVIKDLKGLVRSWNPAAEQLFGYIAGEMIGRPVSVLLPADRSDEGATILERISRGESIERYETVRRRKDGSLIEISLTVSPIRDAQGQIVAAAKVASAITDKRAAENAQRRLAAIVDSSDDAIVSKDLKGIIQSWNPGAERLFGYTAEEAVGKPVTLLIPLNRQSEETDILMRIQRGEKIDHYETIRRCKNGMLIDVSLSISPIRDAAGNIIGASKIARDISERNRNVVTDRRLAAIVSSSDDAILSKDLNGVILSWNPGAQRLFGYTAEEIVGKPVLVLIPEGRHDEEPAILARLRRGERIEHYETIRRRKDGSLVEVSLSVSPIRDEKGKIVGAAKIARDISVQKQAIREMAQARDKAVAANRAKDDFLAALSHELRTPLNPVLLIASERADDRTLPEKVRTDFDQIRKNVQLEARLIDDLLDLSGIVKGQVHLNSTLQDLHVIVHHAIATIRPDMDQKKQVLTCDIAPTVLWISGDEARLQQVLWNVLNNAVKYTPERGRIHVSTKINPARDCAVVEIADSGIGLNGESLEYIFDAFAQMERTGKPGNQFGGLGLGLTISRLITELHHGSIRAASEGQGRGATFIIELPLADLDAVKVRVAKDRESARGTPAVPTEAKKKRILLIEDHDSSREALHRLLTRRSFDVVTATSAAEAREAASTGGEFDVVISDIGLPDDDGCNLIAEIREKHDWKVVALTGFGMTDDIARSQRAGALAHLTKPISIQDLDRVLELALRNA